MTKKINLFDFTKVYEKGLAFLQEHPRFSIWVYPGFLGVNNRKICKKILDPLLPSTTQVLVYELQSKNKKVLKYSNFIEEKYGRHILHMSDKKWEYFIPLLYKPSILSTIHEIRGSILIECSIKNLPWESILKHCSGPYTVSNASVGCGKAALSYTKNKTTEYNVFFIIEKTNSGLESITITSHKKNINRIFNIAAKTCYLSKQMENNFRIMEKYSNKNQNITKQ
jgi:hypothetical protein